MLISRRSLIASTASLAAAASAAPLFAQTPTPLLSIYDDGLGDSWSNQSWAKVDMDVVVGGHKTIRVSGDPWSGLSLHHDSFSIEAYKNLVFYINGGLDGGQTITVQLLVMGKPVVKDYSIDLKAKTWSPASIPLKDIAGGQKMIDGVLFQGRDKAYTAYYITKIGLEA